MSRSTVGCVSFPARTAVSLLAGAALVAGAAIAAGAAITPATVITPATDSPSPTATFSSRAPHGQGIGDPYYPADGNRGYDVKRYFVQLDYFRKTEKISARTTIRSVATERLTRVNFDLLGLTVRRLQVNDRRATFERKAVHELVITPAKPIRAGDHFKTVVTYDGKPTRDHTQIPSGWFDATTPGTGFIAGEPHSCTVWYPCNDHPTDKAAFRLSATVPNPLRVVSVGRQGKTTGGMRGSSVPVHTYRWRLNQATATYLTTIYIDRLTFERSRLRSGIPVLSAYGPNARAASRHEAKLPQVLRVLSRRWGPYPATTAGGIFVTGDVPFSLETFGRPIYTEGANVGTIVHENGHQWWGDNVSIRRWRDICLNECLASYSQWLWREHRGQDLDRSYRSGVEGTPTWLFGEPLYDMGAGNEFNYGVYVKGPYFVHALRNKIGDHRFFDGMQAIQRQFAGGNLSMLDLREILEHKTGVDLTSFWRQWVLNTGAPSRANLYPGDL